MLRRWYGLLQRQMLRRSRGLLRQHMLPGRLFLLRQQVRDDEAFHKRSLFPGMSCPSRTGRLVPVAESGTRRGRGVT